MSDASTTAATSSAPAPLASVLDLAALQAFLAERGEKAYRLKQIHEAIFTQRITSWDEALTLPTALREELAQRFTLCSMTEVLQMASGNKETRKWLLQTHDGKRLESVLMHHVGKNGKKRTTLCISCQVGCAMACTFCATGTMGLKRNLTAAEILEQVLIVRRHSSISNIVFMGMGEPLTNTKAVLAAIQGLKDPHRFALGARHITVSTCGIIPGIKELQAAEPQVNLAISLHAPNQELRAKIMPISRPYPLEKLMECLQEYFNATGRRIFYEYVMLRGVNDQPEHAQQLGRLLQGTVSHVNLIPYNPTEVEAAYLGTERDHILQFANVVQRYGVPTTVRRTMGTDIDGACGQLVLKTDKSHGSKMTDEAKAAA